MLSSPLLHFSLLIFSVFPLPSSAHSSPTTGNPRFTEFFAASTMTSLWKSLMPKLAAFWVKPCRRHKHFRSFQEQKTELQTPPSSENVRKSHAKQAKAQATRTGQKKYPHPPEAKTHGDAQDTISPPESTNGNNTASWLAWPYGCCLSPSLV